MYYFKGGIGVQISSGIMFSDFFNSNKLLPLSDDIIIRLDTDLTQPLDAEKRVNRLIQIQSKFLGGHWSIKNK